MTTPTQPAILHHTDSLPFGHSFATLPPAFFTRLMPTPLPSPYLVAASASAAKMIGLDPEEFSTANFVESFSGNRLPAGAMPIAAVYSGHQFGIWAGQLGDGRALLLGDVPAHGAGQFGSMELQLKGAGPTPYSRMGDGRAVLRSSIREFLCSEAMAGLGIPTSGVLCVTGSDLRVIRETPETAAVVTRMAPTFLRFGSFEHWFYSGQPEALKTLADYVIDRFYPDLRDAKNPYHALLAEVTRRTAHLMAQWQAVGFMHGVMNTDNMSILGLTIDYGPFGFMDAFDPGHICNHTDHHGRYAYDRQPDVAYWNCAKLARTLAPLIGGEEETRSALDLFGPAFSAKADELLHAKLGLQTSAPDDVALFDAMFALMRANRVDFTLFFRRLGELQIENPTADDPVRDLVIDRAAFDAWAARYRARLRREGSADGPRRLAMDAVNPQYVLRNYLAQVAIEKAQQKDFSEIERLLTILEKPFDPHPDSDHYARLPPDWGTRVAVSCSS
ncbi:MAG: YdiU family protein [Nitrospirae bacterium]|nr:YdiU family protein [Nitrospirota bacterium]